MIKYYNFCEKYFWKVFRFTKTIFCALSQTWIFAPTACPEAERLNVGSVQPESISLTWGNTTNPGATRFTLVATPQGGTPIVEELDLSTLEYVFEGLMSGTEYDIVLYINGTDITDSVTETTCKSASVCNLILPLGNNFPIIPEYSRIFQNIFEHFWML